MGAGKLAASSCHGDRTVGKPVSWEGKEGERRKQRLGVGWGGGAGGGGGEPTWEEPSDSQCLGSFPDHSGPLGPSKSPALEPEPERVNNLCTSSPFPICPTPGYLFPVNKYKRHLICKTPPPHLHSRDP